MWDSRGLRAALKALMKEEGLSINAVSRALGRSATGLSQWLSEKYQGDNKKLEAQIASFVTLREESRDRTRLGPGFVRISAAARVFEAARVAHLDGQLCVAYGPAGVGKTEAVRRYASDNSGVIVIEANLGYTARALFAELHRVVGYDGNSRTLHALWLDVVKRLRNSGRLIIVDEAEHLPYRALDLLRSTHDVTGVGLLLVGLPRLIGNLRGRHAEYAQLFSRIGLAARIEPLTLEDAEALVQAKLPSVNGLAKVYFDVSGGNARTLSKLIDRSMRIAEINNVAVDKEIIQRAAEMLIF